MIYGGLDYNLLIPPFLAGMLILLTHVPLGNQVLKRGIIFIDLAIAQMAGLGVIVAALMYAEPPGWLAQIAAFCMAMAGALLLTFSERYAVAIQEALIGVLFVLAASGAMLLLAHDPHQSEHFKDLLAGQILWVSYHDLIPASLLTFAICCIAYVLRNRLPRIGFYLVFACSITLSVQLAGIYLVFASLIIPALSTRHLQTANAQMMAAYCHGALSYLAGLIASIWFDLPTGPAIVWAMAVLGLAAYGLLKLLVR